MKKRSKKKTVASMASSASENSIAVCVENERLSTATTGMLYLHNNIPVKFCSLYMTHSHTVTIVSNRHPITINSTHFGWVCVQRPWTLTSMHKYTRKMFLLEECNFVSAFIDWIARRLVCALTLCLDAIVFECLCILICWLHPTKCYVSTFNIQHSYTTAERCIE